MNKKYLYIETTIGAVVVVLYSFAIMDCFTAANFDVQLTVLCNGI